MEIAKETRTAVRVILSRLLKKMGLNGLNHKKRGYQDGRFPEDQYELISKTPDYKFIKNVLEVGCNQGKLINMIAADEIFAIGVDIKKHWDPNDQGRALLGTFAITTTTKYKLPSFDAILLLSVHHQWVNKHGDDYAKTVVKTLYEKCNVCMYIEFAALADKYGYKQGEFFVDNDERSIIAYAQKWLASAGIPNSDYLGPTRELAHKEPFRYLFVLKKASPQ